jgi:mRNA interferase HigB
MRIIMVGRSKGFWEQPTHRDAKQPLRAWLKVGQLADWSNPPAIKHMFNNADILRWTHCLRPRPSQGQAL